MEEFILKYSGILGILAALYVVFILKGKTKPENPNTNDLGVYVVGIVLAVVWYYLTPFFLLLIIQFAATYVIGFLAIIIMFAPLLIVIAIVTFFCKNGMNKAKIVTMGILFILFMTVFLGVNNVNNAIVANIKDFNYYLASKKMHDIRYELMYPAAGITEDEFNELKKRYINLYDEREKLLQEFHKAHQSLAKEKSSLYNFDHLTSALFIKDLEAIRAEEDILKNGGSLEEAVKAYERIK